jgi:hypothetical protein
MLSHATYCTREDVLSTLQQLAQPRAYPQIDRAIETATENIDQRCNRTFLPYTAQLYFDWPDRSSSARSWRLWLDANELISATTVTSGGTAITSYLLEPQKYGPPYTHLEIDLRSSQGFSAGPSEQRAISITGLWGYADTTQAAGALSGAVVSTSATALTVSDGSLVGVGDLLLIDTERLVITGRSQVSTGQTLQTPLTASAAGTSVVVTTGSAYHVGETILLDAEAMAIVDIAGNTLLVERSVNGTVLATHTGSTIYSPRTLSVIRGANGSTAATHLDAAAIRRNTVPSQIRSLAVAESLVEVQQGLAGYARTAGSGDNARTIGSGPGLNDLRDQVGGLIRSARIRAV